MFPNSPSATSPRLTPAELDALEAKFKRLRAYEEEGNGEWADVSRLDLIDALPALLAEIRELRALTTPEPIGEKHEDGNWWLVWCAEHWLKCRWSKCGLGWQMFGTATYIVATPTHATALPPAPEEAPNV